MDSIRQYTLVQLAHGAAPAIAQSGFLALQLGEEPCPSCNEKHAQHLMTGRVWRGEMPIRVHAFLCLACGFIELPPPSVIARSAKPCPTPPED